LELDAGYVKRSVGGPGCNVVSELAGITACTRLEGQVININVEEKGANDAALRSASKKRDRSRKSRVDTHLDGAVLEKGRKKTNESRG
jgi:hypothetical protein